MGGRRVVKLPPSRRSLERQRPSGPPLSPGLQESYQIAPASISRVKGALPSPVGLHLAADRSCWRWVRGAVWPSTPSLQRWVLRSRSARFATPTIRAGSDTGRERTAGGAAKRQRPVRPVCIRQPVVLSSVRRSRARGKCSRVFGSGENGGGEKGEFYATQIAFGIP